MSVTREPAFPVTVEQIHAEVEGHGVMTGMALRDWFAGQALAGLMSRKPATGTDDSYRPIQEWRTEEAYRHADAMLAAREES